MTDLFFAIRSCSHTCRFNLLIDRDTEELTMIDFPQMVSVGVDDGMCEFTLPGLSLSSQAPLTAG